MLSIFDVRVRFFMRAFVPFVGYFTRTRFFLEFPQHPGGVMTRRTVFTRQIITVESVFTRSDWLLYP